MRLQNTPNGMAFGVDPTRKEFFSLRQARYDALGEDITKIARERAAMGQRTALLDIGPFLGVTLRHVENYPGHETIDYSVADLEIHPELYKKERMVETFVGDIMAGYPEIQSDKYDIVVCEQVLEHLSEVETPIKALARVLKPGGTLFLGVPTFPHGLHYLREYGQKPWDRIFPPNKVRGHIQTFTKPKLLRLVRRLTNLQVKEVRGFRIMSGGFLRPLENQEWAWRLNRWLGRVVPGLSVEIQGIFIKPEAGSRQ